MLTDDVPVAVVSIDGSIIADLYVHPNHQRRGYGTKILEYAMSQCDSYPILWVLNTNQGDQRLYEHLGFQKSGKFKELKNGLFEIEMVCKKG